MDFLGCVQEGVKSTFSMRFYASLESSAAETDAIGWQPMDEPSKLATRSSWKGKIEESLGSTAILVAHPISVSSTFTRLQIRLSHGPDIGCLLP